MMWSYLSRTGSMKTKPEILYSPPSPSPPPPNINHGYQSWLNPFHHINFSIPTVQSSHLQPQQCFQNMNLMFSFYHTACLKYCQGFPLALRIETKILSDVWYSPNPPLRLHPNHTALRSLHPATLATLQFHGKRSSSPENDCVHSPRALSDGF